MPMSLAPQPQDDEIECAQCGAILPLMLSRCPACDVNLYEPAAAAADGENTRTVSLAGPTWWARFLSWGRGLLGLPEPAGDLFTQAHLQATLYQQLLQKVAFDRATAERLITFEQHRAPHRTRVFWLQCAIERWEKDNHA